jgi:hypothetical protein
MPRFLSSAAFVLVAGATAAAAQTAEERIAGLERRVVDQQAQIDALEGGGDLLTDRSGVKLTFGGRVNAMVLHADQGPNDQAFIADNDGSGSRLEFLAESRLDDELAAGLEIVVSAEVNSSDEIDFGSTDDSADENADLGEFRQAHIYVESTRFGYISLGQGDTAAEDTAHVDLSGTDFAGAGSDVDDVAGGLTFADADGDVLTELDDFFDMQDGSRAVRAIYVTPGFGGFSLAASLANSVSGGDGDDDVSGSGLQPALAVRYEGELAFGELAGALSYRREILDDDVENGFIVGSASLLLESGFNVTVAASRGDIDGQDADPTATFVKLGYLTDLTELGETRFSIDAFRGEANAEFGAPGGDLVEAQSVGFFAVQEISDLNTETYVGIRRYALDDVFVDGIRSDVDDMTTVLAGARIRF